MNGQRFSLGFRIAAAALAWAVCATVAADDAPATNEELSVEETHRLVDTIMRRAYTKDGADACLKCHDEDNRVPILPIFKTRHAAIGDERTPAAGHQCEACHGPAGDHAETRVPSGEHRAPMINFGSDTWAPVAEQNGICLGCHQEHQRLDWQGGTHAFNEVSCAACHTIHVSDDPVLQPERQQEACYDCHAKERADFFKPSHHPVREGEMACSDCHDVHGDTAGRLTLSADLREQCTTCHAEVRGPFLWEHAPAAEDCTLCHDVHGSNQPALLNKRVPFLCQQCHAESGHPSVRYDGESVAPRGASRFVMLKGCLNCHFQVHGSNHPSGVALTR